jgi:hypothetical protein
MPLTIIINNQSIGRNRPEIAAVKSGQVQSNTIGEAWIVPTEHLAEVWRPEADIWEVAIQGEGTYAGSHKVKYLRLASDVELNQMGIYTAGFTGSDNSGTKVVKDTGYVVTASTYVKITAENASITCDKHSSGTITAVRSKITISEESNITVNADDCVVTASSGKIIANKSKVYATGSTIVVANSSTVEASDSASVTSVDSKVTVDGNAFLTTTGCTVIAKGQSIVRCHDNKVKVTAYDHVVCIVDDIEESHATLSFSDSTAKQRFILNDHSVVISKVVGDYVWTASGKYCPMEAKSFKEISIPTPKRGRPRSSSASDEGVAVD